MEDFPHLYAAITMGRRASPGGDQRTAPPVALLPQLGVVVMRVAGYVAYFAWPLLQQPRGHLVVAPVGHGQYAAI